MKFLHLIVLLFLFSCSSNNEGVMNDNNSEQPKTYFDQIFWKTQYIFNEYELGNVISDDIISTTFLSKSDSCVTSIKATEGLVSAIELQIHVEEKEEAHSLISNIVNNYNEHLNHDKAPSNFITWTYNTPENLPVEVSLIYDEKISTISLNIGYKSQR